MKSKVVEWSSIKDEFTDKLLLGNGASIAVWEAFRYGSLYDKAVEFGLMRDSVKRIFKHFKTRDFEYILKLLREANSINKMLDIKENSTFISYKEIREALIETVSAIHPKSDDVEHHFLRMAIFMKQFHTVLSLSYDLLVYWAMLRGNDVYRSWFKDAFVDDGRFRDNFVPLYEPYGGAGGSTLVFYPHGNLILVTQLFGDEVKIKAEEEVYLLNTIIGEWRKGNCIPLFVSEGTTHDKLEAIKRSNYLHTVYDDALSVPCDTVAIYGWSLRPEDEHILSALISCQPKMMAISVHTRSGDIEAKCEKFEYTINSMYRQLKREKKIESDKACKIVFYDAQSKECWNN